MLRKQLEREVRRTVANLEAASAEILDIQLIARITGSASYVTFRSEQERAWNRQGGTYSTKHWPAAIEEGELAVVLIPAPAGRVGLAAGKHPKPVAPPLFSRGRPVEPGNYDDIVLGLLTTWMSQRPDDRAVRLAPPVAEVFQRRGVVARRVIDFGQPWQLPAPDGV